MNSLLNPGITIFGFTIYYYAIVIVIGMLAASALSAAARRLLPLSFPTG